MANTKISYRYVDAAKNTRWGDIVLEGEAGDGDREKIEGSLYDGEFFVPEAVGLDGLQALSGELDPDIDHPYHIFDSMETVGEEPDFFAPGLEEVVETFAAMTSEKWEEAAGRWREEQFETVPGDVGFLV